MFINIQIECPNCHRQNEVLIRKDGHREVFCPCGQFICVKEESGNLTVEYYYQGRINRETIGHK